MHTAAYQEAIISSTVFIKKVAARSPQSFFEKPVQPALELALSALSSFEALLTGGETPYIGTFCQKDPKMLYLEQVGVNRCLRRAQTFDAQGEGWICFGQFLEALKEVAEEYETPGALEKAEQVYISALEKACVNNLTMPAMPGNRGSKNYSAAQ